MRLLKAIKAFLKALREPETAEAWLAGEQAETAEAGDDAGMEGAGAVLALLQREGRLIDFLKEDIAALPDDQIGAAARVVHSGSREVLEKYVKVEAIRTEQEGQTVDVPQGFDPAEIRLSGRVAGDPPFRGVLQHKGWRITDVALPAPLPEHRSDVVAPAEVDIP